ncbi:MAG: hypothetical protein U0003_03730 [Vampirovibrionales bacterium]
MIRPASLTPHCAFASHAPYYKASDLKSSYEAGFHYEKNGKIVEPGQGLIYRMTTDDYDTIQPKESILTDGKKAYKVLALGNDTITIQESVDKSGLRGAPTTLPHNEARRQLALYSPA